MNPDSNGNRLPDRSTGDDDGVDETLIDWMLSLTPTERLQVLQRHVNAVHRLRTAVGNQTGRRPKNGAPEDGEN
jgi:hypothetical protein